MDASNESREDVLHVPNLFDFFCQRTGDDMISRGGSNLDDTPATSFASLIITLLISVALYIFGKPGLAKASFVFFAVLLAWTVWGVVIRSSEQISQKADSIKSGVFPPQSMPFAVARLKWWNHLITPLRWGRHSRLFDRKGKLERRIAELQRKVDEAVAAAGAAGADYVPPSEEEVIGLASSINSFADRNNFEMENLDKRPDTLEKARANLLLHLALHYKLQEMSARLEKIEKLNVMFHNVSVEDLSQVVSEAIQMLEERRILVLMVDKIDPEDFLDLVTVRTG